MGKHLVQEKVETLIIGAGVIGSSVTMHLAQKGMTNIRVIDFDLEGTLSSSELNAGGVRATWVHPLNIEMSKLTIEYLAQHAEDVGYRDCGYLWLHRPDRFDLGLAHLGSCGLFAARLLCGSGFFTGLLLRFFQCHLTGLLQAGLLFFVRCRLKSFHSRPQV